MKLKLEGHYDDHKKASITVVPQKTTHGITIIFVSEKQLKAAAKRAGLISGDYMELPPVDGYYDWEPKIDGFTAQKKYV